MKDAPLILIIPNAQREGSEFGDRSVSLSNRYALAVLAAGGLPWILPYGPKPGLAAEAVRRAQGVLLTGGDDVQPELYAPKLPPRLRIKVMEPDPERDVFEIAVLRAAFRQRKPVLAICRGLQILNVALGGTLLVDIPTQLPAALNHRRMDRKDQVVHDIEVLPGSLLERTVGPRLGVNSSHHQSADRIAPSLRATALSPDGVIEALEWKPGRRRDRSFLLAVQFHPERLATTQPEHRALFTGFVKACERSQSTTL